MNTNYTFDGILLFSCRNWAIGYLLSPPTVRVIISVREYLPAITNLPLQGTRTTCPYNVQDYHKRHVLSIIDNRLFGKRQVGAGTSSKDWSAAAGAPPVNPQTGVQRLQTETLHSYTY